jgi:DNA-binding NarL/FixJ family response regulator
MSSVFESQLQRGVTGIDVDYEEATAIKPRRILLVEDQPVFRDAFETLLRSSVNPTELVSVDSLAQLANRLSQCSQEISCGFIDLHLPDATDSQALLAVQEILPQVPLVVMTGYASDPLRRRCLGLGAFDLLNKNWDHATLVDRIKQIFDSIDENESGGLSHSGRGPVALTTLSPRQKEVMRLLLKGRSNKEISNELQITEGTVKTHVTRVLRVLRVTTRSEAIAQYSQLRI